MADSFLLFFLVFAVVVFFAARMLSRPNPRSRKRGDSFYGSDLSELGSDSHHHSHHEHDSFHHGSHDGIAFSALLYPACMLQCGFSSAEKPRSGLDSWSTLTLKTL